MIQKTELFLRPEEAAEEQGIKHSISHRLQIPEDEIASFRILKRSVDARSSQPKIHLIVEVFSGDSKPEKDSLKPTYPSVKDSKSVVIIGSGPAGLFSALKLIEQGIKPILIERGKDVQSRRHDLAAINKKHLVNPDSNYCFGEGGAGTYSDGKLYTRSTKRGDVDKILDILIWHGASPEIKIDSHPHIGTNKLPKIIQSIRQTILECGGEILFETRLQKFQLQNKKITGIEVESIGDKKGSFSIQTSSVILATGHSARDVFHLLHNQGILIEPKPFALGLRIEHPQQIIDSIQYHCETRNPLLPPAAYAFAHQIHGKGVYSFCMCPGGFIVPSATATGEVVVNGMSPSRRDSKYSNSGIVVSVELDDIKEFHSHGPLAFLEFQKSVEQTACRIAGGTQAAPAQRMMDFVEGKISGSIPENSYQPGTTSVQLSEVLPPFIGSRMKEGFKEAGRKMKGYLTNEAVLLGVESRTSSPVRIPRDKESLMHTEINGLFPCGEGAGYAGGIVSAAIDGERCGDASAEFLRRS